jgi:hypothetical protein
MLNVLYIRDRQAQPSADGGEERFFYKGRRPRLLYRLRLGEATLVTADARMAERAGRPGCEISLETIRVAA